MFDWITGFVEQSGYLGIFLLMFAETVFPPIPSELIMPMAGFLAAEGKMNAWAVLGAGTAGAVFGAWVLYFIARLIGYARTRYLTQRFGRIMTFSPEELDEARAMFSRHRGKAVFFGRLIPAMRSLISIPAGVDDMPVVPFLLYTAAGSAIWSAFLVFMGYVLQSQYALIEDYVNPVSNAVLVIIIAVYVYRLVRGHGRSRSPEGA